jgi:hypothetical protein
MEAGVAPLQSSFNIHIYTTNKDFRKNGEKNGNKKEKDANGCI